MKRIIAVCMIVLFILIGIGIMLFPLISSLYADQNHTQAIRMYDTSISEMERPELILARSKAESYNVSLQQIVSSENPFTDDFKDQNDGYYELLNIRGDGIMGYVRIPSIEVSLPIYHGTDDQQLSKGAGHLINSSLPIGGSSTNTVISAHTAYTKSTMFDRLTEMKVGDMFYLHVLDEVLAYEVELSEVVKPHETDLFRIVEGKDLATLVTCYPYGVNSHRLIVRGIRVEYEKEIDTVVDAPLGISGPNLKPYLILGMIGLGAGSTVVTVKIDERLRRKKNEV